jgi:polysaccharide chain length determinant protein (PEP-CTERM system associated)
MNDTQQDQIEKYWQIILRRKYLFIAVSLITLSFIVWGSFFMPKIYRAESTFYIKKSLINEMVKGVEGGRNGENNITLGLQQTMLSSSVLHNVIKILDLDTNVEEESKTVAMIADFKKNTEIIEQDEENLFIVSYEGKDPKMVKDYVNTLIVEYIDTIRSTKKKEAYGASKFLKEQIDYYDKKIDSVEEEIADFRRKEGIYLAVNEEGLVNSIRDNTEELENVEMEIEKLRAKKNKITQQLSGEEPFTLAMIESNGENSMPARLKLLEQRLSMLLTKYTENYPEVIKVKLEIETIKKQLENKTYAGIADQGLSGQEGSGMSMMNPIYQQLKEEQLSIESEIDSLRAKRENLNGRIQRTEEELKNIPKNKKVLANMERDKNTYQMSYEKLIAKMGQAEVNEQVQLQDKGEILKVVEAAGLPKSPVSPDRIMIIFLGIVAGIGAGIGVIMLIEQFDSSVRDIDLMKSHFGMKILAVIPEIVSENDITIKQKRDRRVYAFSILYLLVIGGVLVNEFINRFFMHG